MDSATAFCALNRALGYNPVGIAGTILSGTPPQEILEYDGRRMTEAIGSRAGLLVRCLEDGLLGWAEREIEECGRLGISVIGCTDAEYPPLLRECPDAPVMLYCRGDLGAIPRTDWISVVGTRRPDSYGTWCCPEITSILCRSHGSPVIVSGLAYGTDSLAHRTALACGVPTVAVMATGADKTYPKAHSALAARIVAGGGALITDFPLGTWPTAVNFLRRNRIIAGASRATVVIQTAKKGGSMVTATQAASYDREVYALPGRVGDALSTGCNYLISTRMAECIGSMEDFAGIFGAPVAAAGCGADGEQGAVLKAIMDCGGSADADSVSQRTGMSTAKTAGLLTALELEGKIYCEDGLRWGILRKF